MKKTFDSNPLGWAFFLAVSWTWCIGMFLPILLVRDFGVGGYLCFAIPNVLGAAAMGFVLKRPGDSERLMERHRPVIRLFSLITICFHLAWLMLVVFPLGQQMGQYSLGIPTLLLFTFAFAMAGGPRSAMGVYLVSLAAGFVLLSDGVSVTLTPEEVASAAGLRLPVEHLLGLAPACIFGFLLCPYLDATFHRARQALDPRGAKVAFALGFGVFFFSMIVLTLVYAPVFTPRTEGLRPSDVSNAGVSDRAIFWLLVHLCVQASFTIGVHLRELMRLPEGATRQSGLAKFAIAAIFITAMMTLSRTIANRPPPSLADPAGDGLSWYRIFMGAYALFFPAYVWLCMIPTRGREPTMVHIRVWLIACAAASPLMYIGFVERRTLAVIPAVALVLLARRFVPRMPTQSEPESAPPSVGPSPTGDDRPRLSLARPPEDDGVVPLEDRRG